MLINSYYEKLKNEFMQNKEIYVEDNKLTTLGVIFLVSAVISYLDSVR